MLQTKRTYAPKQITFFCVACERDVTETWAIVTGRVMKRGMCKACARQIIDDHLNALHQSNENLPEGAAAEIIINTDNIVWAQKLAAGVVHLMMLNGPELDVRSTLDNLGLE